MPDQNPIYDFLKSNKLTDLDEKSFVTKYSAPEKAKEIHSFFVENNLTDLDSAGFYDKYLKKKVGGEISSPTESKSPSREYLSEGQELADKGFIKTEKLDPSQLVSQYKSPDISLTPKPKKDYYSSKLEKGLIFDKEGKLFAPSSEALTKDITAAEEIDLKKSTQKDLVEKSREMAVVEEEPVPIEKQGWLLNTVSALDKGFAKNFISSPIKGLGTVLQGVTKKVLGGTGEGYVSNALIKYGDYLNNAIDELTPQDEEFKGTLLDQAAQAIGQVGSLVFTGGLAGAGKGATAALVSEVPKGAVATAAKALGSQLSSPTAVSAGLSMGQAEFDRAKEAGATDDQAFEAFYKNAAVGSVLETIPVMQFFKRFNNSTGGSVANYIKTKGVAGLTGGIEEMTTEVMQQLYSNKTAKDIYNINQDILDGVGSSGGVGFGVGFLLNAMGANAKILRKQGKVQEAAVLENQVKQYEDNLENPKVTSGNSVSAKDIVTQGVEAGTQKAVKNLDRDLANNVITPEKYQEGIDFAAKAAQVADKIPETVTEESRVKSIELLVERNDIKQANQNLLQQKQTTDEAYHAGIDEEIKANEERIKKIDSEVYNIAKKPSKEFGTKKYVIDGEEVSKEEFEALQGKPLGTKTIIEAPVTKESKQAQINENEQVTQDDIKKAEAKLAAAKDKFEKAKNKIEATQVKQTGLFGGEQKGMFAMGGEEAKSTLDPLRKAAKEAKAELDNLRNRVKVQEQAQPELTPISTEVEETANALKSFDKIIKGNKTVGTEVYHKAIDLIDEKKTHTFTGKGWGDVAEAYHKALKSGKNPELVELIDRVLDRREPETTITLENGVKKYFVEGKEVTKERLEEVAGFPAEDHYVTKIYKPEQKFLAEIRKEIINQIDQKELKLKKEGVKVKSKTGVNDKYVKESGISYRLELETINDYEKGIINKEQLLEVLDGAGYDIKQFEKVPKKTYQEALKEKQEAEKKQTRQVAGEKAAASRRIFEKVYKMDAPEDAEQIALRYLADGGKVSKEAVDEAYGSVKRAQLNVNRRELLSEEVKSKDFVGGKETLDEVAHRLWEENGQRISERDIKEALMAEIGNNNTRLEAAESYLDKYNADYQIEKEELRLAEIEKEKYLEEQEEVEKELRKPLDEQIEGLGSEEHINNLIEQYEAEIKGEDQQLRSESEGKISAEAGKGEAVKEAPKGEEKLAQEYKEVIKKASKKAKENAKKDFVDRNFDKIVEKLKIQIKCPT